MWSQVFSRSRSETVAVVGGGDAQAAVEAAAQGLGGAEAVAAGDGLERVAAVLQGPLRRLHPDPLDVGGGRDAELGGEAPCGPTRSSDWKPSKITKDAVGVHVLRLEPAL